MLVSPFTIFLAFTYNLSQTLQSDLALGLRACDFSFGVYVGFRALVFEYSIRDFFECQNIVEVCWFYASVCSICDFFEAQKDVCCGGRGLMFFVGRLGRTILSWAFWD